MIMRFQSEYEKNQQKTEKKEIDINKQETWDSISENYDMIQGAQLSNSFIILMALNEVRTTAKHNSNIGTHIKKE